MGQNRPFYTTHEFYMSSGSFALTSEIRNCDIPLSHTFNSEVRIKTRFNLFLLLNEELDLYLNQDLFLLTLNKYRVNGTYY